MPDNQTFIDKQLTSRKKEFQLRSLQEVSPESPTVIEIDKRKLINFSSNDYLGLAQNEQLAERCIEFTRVYGVGSTASRLVCGSYPFFAEIERKLAELKGTESSLIFNSGFQANVGLFPALTNRKSLIVADRLCHNSIVQGALLSRCKLLRYRHNDYDHLLQLLDAHSKDHSRIIIVTESVFSMDGDRCDLDEIIALAKRFDAISVVDEAHATGVLGEKGMGLACGRDIDIVMGTFGKGCGSFGAYIACSEQMKQYLVNYCSGFIYTTALPPPVLGAVSAALDLVPTMGKERAHLHDIANYLRKIMHDLGLSTGNSTTQIVPIIIGEDNKTLDLSLWLEQQGIFAVSIRPPTVESGQARIRVALSCQHTYAQIEKLIDAIKSWKR